MTARRFLAGWLVIAALAVAAGHLAADAVLRAQEDIRQIEQGRAAG